MGGNQNPGSTEKIFEKFKGIASNKRVEALADLLRGSFADLINTPDDADWAPLHTAAAKGFTTGVRLLIAAGAKVDKPRKCGYTALILALEGNHPETAAALVEAGADVNHRVDGTDFFGDPESPWSPLLMAAGHCPGAVKTLLDKGADPNAEPMNGWTPFLMAVSDGNVDAARLIAGAGGEVSAALPDGRNALDLARKSLEEARGKYKVLADRPWEEMVEFVEGLGIKPWEDRRAGVGAVLFSERCAINTVGMEFVSIGESEGKKIYLGRTPVTEDQWKAVSGHPLGMSPGENREMDPGGSGTPGRNGRTVRNGPGADQVRLITPTVHSFDRDRFIGALNSRERHLGVVYRFPRVEEWLAMFHPLRTVEAVRADASYPRLEREMLLNDDAKSFHFRPSAHGNPLKSLFGMAPSSAKRPANGDSVAISPFEAPGSNPELCVATISAFLNVTDGYENQDGHFLCVPGNPARIDRQMVGDRTRYALRLVMETI